MIVTMMLLLLVIVIISAGTIWLLIITITQILKRITRMICSIILLLIYQVHKIKSTVMADAIERMSTSLEDAENVNADLSFLIRFKKSKDLQLRHLVHLGMFVHIDVFAALCTRTPMYSHIGARVHAKYLCVPSFVACYSMVLVIVVAVARAFRCYTQDGQPLTVPLAQTVQGMCAKSMTQLLDHGKACKALIPKATE